MVVGTAGQNRHVAEPDTPIPLTGRIRSVRGRNTAEPERGLPKVSEIVLEHGGGRVIEASLEPFDADANLATARVVASIGGGRFEFCPICHDAAATTLEHVPARAFGGHVMTMTCPRCNNDLGSRTESAMQDWFDGAYRVHYTVDDNPTPFGRDRAFLRTTANQEFVILAEKAGQPGDGFRENLRPGTEAWIHVSALRPAEFKTGCLKNAYLAASLHLGGVPDVASAREIRAELVAARDARRRNVVLGARARPSASTGPGGRPPVPRSHCYEPTTGSLAISSHSQAPSWSTGRSLRSLWLREQLTLGARERPRSGHAEVGLIARKKYALATTVT